MGDAVQARLDVVIPQGHYVLISPDPPKEVTSGGIHLPGKTQIPVVTGRILALGPGAKNHDDYDINANDKVIYRKDGDYYPCDVEEEIRDDKRGKILVHIDDIMAAVRKE